MTALIGRLSVTLLVVGSNKVTSRDAVLKTIPRVPCAPGPAVVPVAPPVELTAVSSRTEPPVPQPAKDPDQGPTSDVQHLAAGYRPLQQRRSNLEVFGEVGRTARRSVGTSRWFGCAPG